MNRTAAGRVGRLERLIYLLAAALVYFGLAWQVITLAATGTSDSSQAWSNPGAMTIRQVSPVQSAQTRPIFLSNMDCGLVSYRLVADGTTRTGCFTESAFGLMDSDSNSVIFNGTDEALPLLPFSPHQVLAPWQGAMELVSLDPVNTGGSHISLYRNPLAVTQDRRNLLLQLTSKQLTAAPDLPLNDKMGQPLVINAQTLAFSDSGSWMVAETLNGSFVRVNLATLDVKPFAPSFNTSGGPTQLKSFVAVTDNGRYVAVANNYSLSFRVYDLANCGATSVNLQPENCPSYDYWPFTDRQIAGLDSISHVRFINDGLLSFEAKGGIYELAPAGSIDSLIDYLGLGDSYTSGEGAFDYLAGTDSADNACHLSIGSYPLLLTHDLFTSHGGHSVACSGAVIQDVASTSESYRGQVRNVPDFAHLQKDNPALLASVMTNFVPGYVAQQRFARQYLPKITTVSVGGDDIGFGDIVERCVIPHISLHLSDSTCFNTYEDRLEVMRLIDRTIPRWVALYKQLAAEAPGTRLYAIGYPEVVSDTGTCALNAQLNKSELEFAEELIDYLNGNIRKAANQAGIVYVDISQALIGHRLCETVSYNVAVNGLTAGKDGSVLGIKVFGKESYHPNALGQQLIEQEILRQTHNLTSVIPPAAGGNTGEALLKAPKTGRVVNTVVPSSKLTAKVVKAGKPASVKASGKDAGLKANTAYTAKLDGPAGPAVGSGNSNSSGDLDITAVVPTGTTPGGHTIDVTGDNQAGEPVDITQPVYVPASDSDADGDGTPDDSDSCPGAVNTGLDTDQDGIDDVCDGFIGPPPSPTGSSNDQGTLSGPASTTDRLNTTPGPASTIEVLPAETITPAAAFTVKIPAAKLAPANIPGRKITSPINTSGTKILSPVFSKRGPKRNVQPPLKGVNWLFWIIFAILLWLLLVILSYWLDRYIDRRSQVAYS